MLLEPAVEAPIVKVLVITDRFIPEIAAPSFRIMDHAKIWRELGHEVVVLTCVPNFPKGRVFPGYKNGIWQEEKIDGIRVIRVLSYMAANEGLFRRTLDNASFMLSAILQSPRLPQCEVILATSPPLFVAVAGCVIARVMRCPWIFEVRDLWPASIKAVGALNGRMLSVLEMLELYLYRDATHIITLTHSFKEDLCRRHISGEKITTVENGVDTQFFSPANVKLDARARLGVPTNAFLVGYIGTVGMAHGVETIVHAAALCKHHEHVMFVVIGEGAERDRIANLAQENGLKNLVIRDFVPHEMMPSYLGCLDAFIVHLRPDPVFRTVIPSKIFEASAMQVPILHAVEGESAGIIRAAGAGVCIPSGDARRMAETVVALSCQTERLKEMGRKGRETVKLKYSRTAKAKEALKCLEAVVRKA